jgi:hypothetical protein
MNNKTWLFSLLISIFFSVGVKASIAPANTVAPQMINLNMQFKAHDHTAKSDISMPLYQTAEIEKKMGKKNYLMSFNPKEGKNPNEVTIEVKFMRPSNSKVIFKKEIVAKLNHQSVISAKGMMIELTPVI